MTILESAIQTVYKWLTAFSVDIVAIELILCAPMRKRKGFGFRLLLFIPFMVTSMIYRSVTGNSFYMLPCFFIGWFAYIFSAMVLLSAILLWFCFYENFLQLLFYAVAAHVIQNLIYMERMILDIVLLQSVTGTAYYLISCLIVVSSAFSICYMLRKQMKKHPFELENRVLIAFSTAAALIVSLLHYWVYAFHYASLATYCYQLLCCCLLLVIQFDIFNTSGLLQEQKTMKQVYSVMEQHHQATSTNIDIINRKCHDLRRQIAYFRQSEHSENRERNLKEIEDAIRIYDSSAQTGCKVLDTLLTDLSLQCEQYAISFTYIIDGEKLNFMEDMDILSLFGNALDNVLECVKKELPENRSISLNVTEQSGILKITLDNYCSTPIQFHDGFPTTTKAQNGYHGFGTRSIQFVVNKYNGTFSMRHLQEENRFCLTVLLQIPQGT